MKSYLFPTITMATALALAAGAALFTILGFRELFEPSLKITYMAATIEFGKIIAVSALYQFRDMIGWIWKGVLLLLILVAMAVTSMGVYGYLSSSYQKDTLALTQNESRLELIEARQETLQARLSDMDAQIAAVPDNFVTKRMELIETFGPERETVLTEITELDEQKLDLTLEQLEKQTEFGAIIVLAQAVDWLDETQAMLYFILAVIFIFDPLAITLTYVANVAYANASKKADEAKVEAPIEQADQGQLLEEVNKLMEGRDAQHSEQIDNLLQSVGNIAEDLERVAKAQNVPQHNPRADVVESMRSST